MTDILLCSEKESVRMRWQDALVGRGKLQQVQRAVDLGYAIGACRAGLALLHHHCTCEEHIEELRRSHPRTGIFLLSDRPNEEEGLAMLRLGVIGYANTYITAARLGEAVAAVLSGSVWIGQQLMQRLIRENGGMNPGHIHPAQGKSVLTNLSRREHEIALLVKEGLSNQDIARRLQISESTVKVHLGHIYTKTDTRNRLNLALFLQ